MMTYGQSLSTRSGVDEIWRFRRFEDELLMDEEFGGDRQQSV
jgi:hypothetical protein